MLTRLLEQQQAITCVLSSEKRASHLIPSWQDQDFCNTIDGALLPLADFTDIMSGEKYVTSSSILPILDLLGSSVLKCNSNDKPMTSEIWSDIIADLSDRYVYPDITKVLEITSMIDPCFKEQYVTDIEGHLQRGSELIRGRGGSTE